eukprot:scaffold3575_cov254-Pinguiococcus_pyrenoidosus.AAC.5
MRSPSAGPEEQFWAAEGRSRGTRWASGDSALGSLRAKASEEPLASASRKGPRPTVAATRVPRLAIFSFHLRTQSPSATAPSTTDPRTALGALFGPKIDREGATSGRGGASTASGGARARTRRPGRGLGAARRAKRTISAGSLRSGKSSRRRRTRANLAGDFK